MYIIMFGCSISCMAGKIIMNDDIFTSPMEQLHCCWNFWQQKSIAVETGCSGQIVSRQSDQMTWKTQWKKEK